MPYLFLVLLFFAPFVKSFAQQQNDNCSGASQSCSGTALPGDNSSATEDTWYPSCYASGKTLWYSFTTNTIGGDVSVSVTGDCQGGGNLHGVLVSAVSCDSTFTEINCSPGSPSGFSLSAPGLEPHTQYWIQVSGSDNGAPSDCNFELNVSGDGIEPSSTANVTNVVCEVSFGSATIENTNAGPGPYTYSSGGQTPQNSPSVSNLSVGSQTVTVTDANGCTHDVNFFVIGEENNLTVDAGEDKTIISGGSTQLNATGNGSAYLWFPEYGLNDPSAQNPIASPSSTVEYTVYTYSEEGCQISDQVIVNVLPPVLIYSAFTPNGDGVNDAWQMRNIELFPENQVTIYSRWGQRVFNTKGYGPGNEFEGKSMGVDLPAATYYYIIDLNAGTDDPEAEKYRGSVTIIR
jgi:gliding motility-associated-like protein